MKTTTRWYALALVVGLCACPPLDHVLRSYGYLPVTPPSNLLLPGTIVWVRDAHPLEFGLVCTSQQVLGSDANLMSTSSTKSISLTDLTSDGITVSANLLNQASGANRQQGLSSLRMSLSNAQVLEVDDATISARSGLAPSACLHAIAGRRNHGDRLTMISSALRADVDYMAGWDSTATLTADGKVAALKDVALSLGISAAEVTDTLITAQGLIWGVRDDSYLVSLFAPEVSAQPEDANRQLLAPGTSQDIGVFIGAGRPRW